MNHITVDYHVHSEISPDAHVSMEEMCKGAVERGMTEIVFTDHYEFYIRKMQNSLFNEKYMESYFEALYGCQKEFSGKILVKAGMEFGQLHLEPEQSNKVVEAYPFDFVLGSVHKIEDIDLTKISIHRENLEQIGDAYYHHLLELAETGNFDCLAHLDYLKKQCAKCGMPYLYEKYRPIVKKTLETIIKRGKGIEINTSCMGVVLDEAMPSVDVLALYRELGGTIVTVGSDSHKAQRIGFGFSEIAKLLRFVGFSAISVYREREPFFVPIVD